MATIITGGTGGLGKEVARRLAQGGVADLVLPVRNARAGEALCAEIKALGCGSVSAPLLDLASLSNVRQFIAEIRSRDLPLQGLLFNAGMQSAKALSFTGDGIESTFAVNHLAHYALLKGLTDLLTPKAMVAWTSSGTHDPNQSGARLFGFRGAQYHTAAMLAKGEYPGAKKVARACRDAYATSKFCNVLIARHFGALATEGRKFFAFDPGLMPGTGLARDQSRIALLVWKHVMPRLIGILPGASSPGRSGEMLVKLMRGQIAAENGSYINYTGEIGASYHPDDEQAMVKDLVATSDDLLARAVSARH